jgi:hypothetical protein
MVLRVGHRLQLRLQQRQVPLGKRGLVGAGGLAAREVLPVDLARALGVGLREQRGLGRAARDGLDHRRVGVDGLLHGGEA